MKRYYLLILTIIPLWLAAQQPKKTYWVENNIRITSEKTIRVLDHSDQKFNAESRNFTLTIRKEDVMIRKDQMDQYLKNAMESMAFSATENISHRDKDFMSVNYCTAKKEGDWGVFFLIREELNGDNLFLGFISTLSKPSNEPLNLVNGLEVVEEANLELGNHVVSPTSKSTDINIDLMKLMKQYSPGIYALAESYYKLPAQLNGNPLPVKSDISAFFKDSIPYRILYSKSEFIADLISALNNRLTAITTLEKSSESNLKEYFSLMCTPEKTITIEKFKSPPARIINDGFPSLFKGEVYKQAIYPSSSTQTTQVNGIYGLISNFVALNYQIKWYNDLLTYYRVSEMTNPRFYLEYLRQFTYSAYPALSFKHYIIRYLSILKKQSPDLYSGLLADGEFRYLLDHSFTCFDQVIDEFNKNKIDIRNELVDKGKSFQEDHTRISIDGYEFTSNNSLNLFNSLIDLINMEASYKEVLSDFHIEFGKAVVMMGEN